MRKSTIILSLALVMMLSACQEYLTPRRDNSLTREQIIADPSYAEGLLLNAYLDMPNGYSFDEVATDDAVTNNRGSGFLAMATGQWNANFNPQNEWAGTFETLYYINQFLDVYEEVDWAPLSGEPQRSLHLKRLRGEAHGVRAWHMFNLLQHHAGIGTNGELLGFPLILEPLTPDQDLELPRNTYAECIGQILNDLEVAIDNLPDFYDAAGNSDSVSTLGAQWSNRMNGYAARALQSRVLLHAASPAFNNSPTAWEEAARATGEFLQMAGGESAFSTEGIEFYQDGNKNDPEIIWRREFFTSNNWEQNNFPPSLFGRGQTNPSQNLVEAFPSGNGYPIDHPNAVYDPADPYILRDPRLYKYIMLNGSVFRGTTINTYQGASKDGINQTTESTRTGYYLRKFMDENVNADPNNPTQTNHFYTLFRFTEVFLNYAEAANEAWGPDGDPNGYGMTAKEAIGLIRARAGLAQPDFYLSSISDVEEMRDLIRNERRLELCFEGFRFWDLRRWEADLTEAVDGAFITDGPSPAYSYQKVEDRAYAPHMIYGPIPFNETIKYPLIQNQGW
ncbi:MAG: RagB/SusD family nutrient uptake outer membrane protein [Bacteroidota bacterium]